MLMRGLGLAAMANAFTELQHSTTADDLSRGDWLGLLIDREATARENKRLGRRLSHARLRQNAVIEDTDQRTPRGLDRGLFQKLATCGWTLILFVARQLPASRTYAHLWALPAERRAARTRTKASGGFGQNVLS